jgi:purine-nucleoside phosphorylase
MEIKELKESVNFIKSKIKASPTIGVILGSGLGSFAGQLSNPTLISSKEIPHYPVSTVEGHEGLLYFGKIDDVNLMVLKGRVHFYEGYSMQQLTYPVRIMAELGIKTLIVTNAAGGINENFKPGDLILITDHINFTLNNPLIGISGSNEEQRFVDMYQAYHQPHIELAEKVSKKLNIPVQKGVLLVSTGPCYETAAEIRMIKILGGDAGTMSTVPEVIVARQQGINVLGISCITNMATGISDQKLNHHEVTVTANRIKQKFTNLVSGIVKELA